MRVAIGVGGRVAVIGAGGGGLCSARNLRDHGSDLKVVVYEMGNCVGGTWKYSEDVGIHSSMYKSLRTNLPKEVMAYPDFPFRDSVRSFPRHEEVQDYLISYFEENKLAPLVRFNTKVERVWKEDGSWRIRSTGKEQEEIPKEEEFDAVLVCNGHYSIPILESLVGVEDFNGDVMHSHDYREPSSFKGQRVLVVGAGPSGVDIAIEIASVADLVIMSNRSHTTDTGALPNLWQRPGVVRLQGNEVKFSDGRSEEVDRIVLATGYHYEFPFMDPSVGIAIKNNVVRDLYRQMIYMPDPTLSFLGLPKRIAPLPFMHYQSLYITAYLSGNLELPSQAEMEKEVDEEWELLGESPERYFHILSARQWPYMERIAKEINQPGLTPVVRKIYEDTSHWRRAAPLQYRNRQYKLLGSGDLDFEVDFEPIETAR